MSAGAYPILIFMGKPQSSESWWEIQFRDSYSWKRVQDVTGLDPAAKLAALEKVRKSHGPDRTRLARITVDVFVS